MHHATSHAARPASPFRAFACGIACLLALFLPSVPTCAATLEVHGGRWFDGERFVPATWYVVDGRLTRHRPARIDVRIDARGAHVMPPYADGHNHDLQNAWGLARRADATVRHGVFYSAQFCASPEDVAGFRGAMGRAALPNTLYATACISARDGHPLGLLIQSEESMGHTPDLDALRSAYVAVDTPEQLAERWPAVLAGNPDIVKVILIDSARHSQRAGKPGYLGRNGLDPSLLPDIVRRTHAAGRRVAAHVDTAADLRVAVDAGVDIIAHLPGYHFEHGREAADYRIDDDTVRRMAERRLPLIATASVSSTMLRLEGDRLAAVQAMQRENLQRLVAAGVPLMIGSDNPFAGPLDEIDYLDALQVTTRAALLRSLAMDTPRLLFPGRDIGRFAEGAEASFLLLDGDPLLDPAALRRIRVAVKQGDILARPIAAPAQP